MDWEWWLQGPLAKLIPGIIFMIGFGIWEGFSNARDSRKALREEQERRGRRNAVEIMDAQVDEQAAWRLWPILRR
ncbi:MAG: hypothetical protein U0841_21960 [Chloroflexia bacterium]